MKKWTKFIVLIAAVALCLSAFAACTPKESETKLDLLSAEWIDANSIDTSASNEHAGEYAHLNKGSDRFTNLATPVVTNKFGDWDSFYVGLGGKHIEQYKKLVIKAKAGNATWTEGEDEKTGPTKLTFKIESTPVIEGGKNEVTVELSEQEKTFEFDLTHENYDIAMKNATKITMFIGVGVKSYQSEVTFTAVYFTTAAPIAENVVNEKGDVTPPLEYTGGDTFSVNSNFKTNDNRVIPTLVDGETKLAVPTDKGEWEFVRTKFSGDLKAFTKLKIVFTAPEGITLKLKLEGVAAKESATAEETQYPGKGTERTTWEWSGFTADNLTDGPEMSLLIFPDPGTAGATEAYEIVIHELVFLK